MATKTGTNGNNDITATESGTIIDGLGGNDHLVGLGDSTLYGGDGNDTLVGGNGVTLLDGGRGNNVIEAGNGPTTIVATQGNNDITTGNGPTTITLGNGNNTITGGNGELTITTGGGNSEINLGSGNAHITLGNGNDVVHAGSGDVTISGGDGNDEIYAGDGVASIEGGDGDDMIVLGAGGGTVSGGDGDDTYVFTPGSAPVVIDGFDEGDQLDLSQLDIDPSTVHFGTDGNGNTVITSDDGSLNIVVNGANPDDVQENTDPPCYLRGTLIRTATGDIAVEDLAIGDAVVTLDGTARPVKWVGRRSYAPQFMARSPKLTPVCFRPGSLGPNMPVRNLYVSHDHAMFLNGHFVDASLLENGTSVVREFPGGASLDYFHVEFEGHAILFAEGAPAESYVNHDNRAMFHNAADYVALYGIDAPAAALPEGGHERSYPAVKSGPVLDGIRADIEDRAVELGYDADDRPALRVA